MGKFLAAWQRPWGSGTPGQVWTADSSDDGASWADATGASSSFGALILNQDGHGDSPRVAIPVVPAAVANANGGGPCGGVASVGPADIGAGNGFILSVRMDATADVTLNNACIHVSNAAMTEVLCLTYFDGVLALPADAETNLDPTDWNVVHQVGTDLSVDGGGLIASTAGGVFWAWATATFQSP